MIEEYRIYGSDEIDKWLAYICWFPKLIVDVAFDSIYYTVHIRTVWYR